MQIDSTRLHEALNEIAIKCHNCDIDAISCVSAIRRSLCDIEADTALARAREVYRCVVEKLDE